MYFLFLESSSISKLLLLSTLTNSILKLGYEFTWKFRQAVSWPLTITWPSTEGKGGKNNFQEKQFSKTFVNNLCATWMDQNILNGSVCFVWMNQFLFEGVHPSGFRDRKIRMAEERRVPFDPIRWKFSHTSLNSEQV